MLVRRPNVELVKRNKDNPDDCDSDYDDLLTYNEVVSDINQEVTDESGEYWQFLKILGIQQKPPKHKDWLGSEYNVTMLWETGEITYKPLHQKILNIQHTPPKHKDWLGSEYNVKML